jgi:hypothetical protein
VVLLDMDTSYLMHPAGMSLTQEVATPSGSCVSSMRGPASQTARQGQQGAHAAMGQTLTITPRQGSRVRRCLSWWAGGWVCQAARSG